MFRFLCHAAAAAMVLFCAGAMGAQFTGGNIAVVRVGGDAAHNGGVAALTSATAAVFIDEYTTAGVYVQTIALPTTPSAPNFALTLGGSAGSEGELHLSTDTRFLTLTGYTSAVGIASGSSSGATAASVPRTVGLVAYDGTVDTTTALTDFANQNNARGAFSTDGSSVWLAGQDQTTGGIRYISSLGVTNSTNLTGTTIKNCRDVAIFNGQLYIAQDKVVTGAVVEALGTGTPTTGSPTSNALPGSALVPGSNSATNSFFFARLGAGAAFNGFDTLYIADAGSATNATPGITKYSFDGANWQANGTIGNSTDAYEGLTASVAGATVTLYATKPVGLYSIVDSSGFNGALIAVPVLLASAPANTALRGVAFSPTPPVAHVPPSIFSFGPDINYQVTGASLTVTLAAAATVTSNAADFNNGNLTVSFSANGQAEDQLAVASAGQIALDNVGNVTFNGNAIGTVSGGANGTALVVSFTTANATPAAAQALLRNITYRNSAVAGSESLLLRTVQAVLNDGAPSNNLSAPAVTHINLVGNKIPFVTVPGAQSTAEDVLISIAGISVSDLDAGSASIILTLSAAHGTVSVASPVNNGVGASNITGNFSSSVTLSGSQAKINTTLGASVTYLPNADFNGVDTLTVASNDLGFSGPGGFKTDQKTIAITVAGANDAPMPVADTATVNRNSAAVLIDVLANDKDPENDALTITDVTAPAHGTATIVGGKISYTPTPGFAGTDTFTYSISDGSLPGIQIVDITTPQTFVPLTIDNGLQFIDNGTAHVVVHEGSFGSAICPVPGVANEYYMTTDRGLALPITGGDTFPIKAYQPGLFRVRVNADGSATIVNRMYLTNENGQPLNSLPNADNPSGEVPLDIYGNAIDVSNNRDGFRNEGLVALADGTFWISDEYGPFLTHFDATGKIIQRLKPLPGPAPKLPNVLKRRDPGRAMEGLCITPDGTRLVGIMQTALLNNGTTNSPDVSTDNNARDTAALRIIVYTLASGAVQEFIYLLEDPALKTAVSDIVAVSNTEFLVCERDNKFPNEPSNRKRLWRINIAGATDVHEPADSATGFLYTVGILIPTLSGQTIEQLTFNKTRANAAVTLAGVGITPVAINAAPEQDLLKFSAFNHDKTEGLATINGGKTIIVANDDDNGVDQGTDSNGDPVFITKYKPGTRIIDGSQLLFINAYETVTVTVANRAPVANAGTLNGQRNTPVPGSLSGSDPDGDALTYTIVASGAHGTAAVTNPTTGAFTYTPDTNFGGTDTFTFKTNDGLADSAPATITVSVANDLPIADALTLNTSRNAAVSGLLPATDADNDAITFTIVAAAGHGSATVTNPATGAFTYAPTAGYAGPDTFTFKATDATADSNVATVTVNVVNRAPVAVPSPLSTPKDEPLNATLAASDADGDALTFSIVANVAHGTLTLTNAATGKITYVPADHYAGPDSFSFKASDGLTDSNVVTVAVSVTNTAPVATAVGLSTAKNTPVSGILPASDDDEDALTFSVGPKPAHGTAVVTDAATGAFTYTPDADYVGPDSFTFTASDGAAVSTPATVSVSVFSHAPIASAVTLNAVKNAPTSGILAASDPDGDALTFSIVVNGAHGTATVTNVATGAFTYVPAAGYAGPDTVTFKANDSFVDSNVATLSISVVNRAPAAAVLAFSAPKNTVTSGNFAASDPDGDALTYSVATAAAKGTATVTNAATGAFTYKPNDGANGTDSFTFKANDGAADSNAALVTVTIANRAPVALNSTLNVGVSGSASGTFLAGDPDGEALTFAIVTNGAHGAATITNAQTGAFMYAPTAGYSGPDAITFKASDGAADSNVATVAVNVSGNGTSGSGNGPAIVSGPTATPAAANVGDTVQFSGASEAGATLTWNFGDGITAAGAAVSHLYQAAGMYTVSLTASTGSGFTVKSVLLQVNEFGSGLVIQKLALSKASIVLDFSTPEANADSVNITGKLAIPAGFNPVGQHVEVNIGGLVRAYDLDANGASANGEFKLTIKTAKGAVKKQSAPFVLALAKGNYKMAFSGEGFTATGTKGKHPVEVGIVVGNTLSEALKSLSYTKTGNVGTAK